LTAKTAIESHFLRIHSDGLVCFAIGLICQAEPVEREGIFGIFFGGLLEIQDRRVEPCVAGLGFKGLGT
jgi:hypothetical protein